ncbi:MAG TPA: protein-disulfide isomerase, partial [Achromobacter sp.]|nr:protein-disulfide isomerase [Achromobacter sp.]
MATPTPTLHYIFDPLCGWCYGAAPLVDAARDIAGLHVAPHGGGMMTGGNRQPVTDALRRYVMPHDERIAGLTGQVFGRDYFDGLLRDSGAVFDSEPPTTAILAAEQLDGRGLDLLKRLQHAH